MALIIFYLILFIIALSTLIYGIFRLLQGIINRKKRKLTSSDDLSLNFSQLAHRTKLKRLLFLTWMTAGCLILAFGGLYRINSIWMKKEYFKTSNQAQLYMNVQAPNISYSNMLPKYDSPVSSHIQMDTYKNIDGYPIAWSPMTFGFGTLLVTEANYNNSVSQIANAYYTQDTKQKIATFFLPKVNYKMDEYSGIQPTHEAHSLKNEPNQLAEVAVSFDKPYSYTEIQKMNPKNLLINWYWIGVNDDTNPDALTSVNYGLDADDETTGTLTDDSYSRFVSNLKTLNTGTLINNTFDTRADAKKQIKKYPTLNQAKFSGVILTGRTENFANLDQESWVFSSNVGLTTPVKSYLKPTK